MTELSEALGDMDVGMKGPGPVVWSYARKILDPITDEEVDGALLAAGLHAEMPHSEARDLLEAFMRQRFGT